MFLCLSFISGSNRYILECVARCELCVSIPLMRCVIDGQEFIKLTETEVKEMVPPIGLAKKILRMIPKVCVDCL